MSVKEFCCGCSLRTGVLILMWVTLVSSALGMLEEIDLYGYINQTFSTEGTYACIHAVYFVTLFALGMLISIAGIYGVQQNKSSVVKCFFYFCCYHVLYNIVLIVVLFVRISWYIRITSSSSIALYNGITWQNMPVLVTASAFSIALQIYFTIVVKSYIASMKKNKGAVYPESTVQTMPMPDPFAHGYNQA